MSHEDIIISDEDSHACPFRDMHERQEGVYKEGANDIVKDEFQRGKAYVPCIMQRI